MPSHVSSDLQSSLPDLKFKSALAPIQGELIACAQLWDGYALQEPVLESTPLNNVSWETLFAYMHRRFGPAHVGGDDCKDLAAGWMLTTPDDCVFVRVSPSLSGPGFSFTPYCQKSEEFSYSLRGQLSPARIEQVKLAYRATLLDLLRPVGVRDRLINALGELDDSDLSEALQVVQDGLRAYEVPRAPSSGYAMPLGLFGGEQWGTLCTIIGQLGNGDMQAGRAAVIARIQSDVFKEAAVQSAGVKRLLLMANYSHRAFLEKGLRLSEAEIYGFNADLKKLSGQDCESALVDQLSLEDVDVAVEFLARLGMSSDGLKKRVERLKIDQAVSVSYDELIALTNQTFPDGATPDALFDPGFDLIAHMRCLFTAQNHPELLNWFESTLARPYGAQAMREIAFHIKLQMRNSQDLEPMVH